MSSYAQVNIQQIKSDRGSYYSAEGSGTTRKEAEQDAMNQIISSIQVSMSVKTKEQDKSKQFDNGTASSEYSQESSIKTTSFATLQNVERLVIQDEPDAKVFMWVAKEEVEKMFAERKKKILDFISAGKTAEQRLQIDDALRNYYWALMLAKNSQDAIYDEFDGKPQNVLTFLPLKIKSVIFHIKANLESCECRDNRYYAKMRFTYEERNAASLQLKYFDGQAYEGPVVVKDGTCELELLSLPLDEKMRVNYEYRFSDEAMRLDQELEAVFSNTDAPLIETARVEIPVKINVKKQTMAIEKKHKEGVQATASADVASVATEPITDKERMALEAVENPGAYVDILRKVEAAIKHSSPREAYPCFTTEGYHLFDTLLTKTGGKISLIGDAQHYEFIKANGQILARSCKVKIKFRNGKTFTENITFRFNEADKKIQSLAFSLTEKAEDDIFNAAASWPEVSRFAILQFMEDYQTAFALKRLHYIDQIFSDDAIIITGSVLKKAPTETLEGTMLDFGRDDVNFIRQNKQQYLTRLKKHFNDRMYTHLTFEDNQTRVINAPRLPKGTAFAIQINQLYDSPVYSDKGYLTLILDASKELPIIHVRLWQPDKTDMMSMEDFINSFKF